MNRKSWLIESFDKAMDDEQSLIKDSDLIKSLKEITRYQSGQLLGQGAQKKIFDCHDNFTERNIAIAYVKNSQKISSNEAFIEEVRIAASLEHPNIVPVYDTGIDDDGRVFFTMKKLEGVTLSQCAFQLNLNEKLEVFLKVCDALAYAHSKKVLHKDLKPDNIQIDKYGQVLVCDWGLASKFENLREDKNKLQGSLAFMAPEQLSGKKLLEKTDIFSLGGILYFLLFLEAPFDEKSCRKRLSNPFDVHPKFDNLKKPKSLIAVCEKSLSLELDQRYETVTELAEEIRSYIRGFATLAENPSLWIVIQKTVKRNMAISAVLISSLIFVSFLTTLSVFRITEEKKVAEIAKIKAEDSELETRLVLNDLRTEKKQRMEVSKASARAFLSISQNDYNQGLYNKSLNAIEQAIKLDPSYKKSWDLHGKILFGMLNFRDCQTSLKKGTMSNSYKWLFNLAEMGKVQEGVKKPSAKQIYNIRKEIVRGKYKFSGLHAIMFHSMVSQYNIDERWMFAEQSYRDNHEHFAGRNDKANFRKELKEDGTYLLDVSFTLGTRMTIVITGLPISELIMNSSGVRSLEFIKNMPIKKLDISNTSVKEIGVLSTLPIEELNIKDTYIVDLKPLRKTQLKRLILGDYPINIKALTSLASLEYIEIPKGVYSTDLLDNLKLTDKISYR